jgi:hypothetical protein
MRALTLFAAAALCVVGCGSSAPAPPPKGFVAQTGAHYSFARPVVWRAIEMTGGGKAVGFQSAPGAHGIPTQVGLGVAEDYPNSLEAAVDLVKGESRIVYPGYRITDERWVKVDGARGYRIDSVYESFAAQPSAVRNIDLYVQTDDRVQLNLFVRGPAEDWDDARVQTMIDSLSVK